MSTWSKRQTFLDRVNASLNDEAPVRKWWYISWRTREGKFLTAAVVEAGESRFGAAGVADKLCNTNYETAELGEMEEIPDDKMPPESYRNRKLTREEVEKLWAVQG